MHRIGSRGFFALVAVLLLGAAACGNDEDEAAPAITSPPAATTPAPATAPSIRVVEPADGATIATGAVTVRVEIQNFTIQDKLGQPAVEGEGHIHYFFDIEPRLLPDDPSMPAVTDDPASYAATASTTHTWMDVKSGEHWFCAMLVNNNHTPQSPPSSDCAKVTVQ